ncbi:MAG: class D beta-lactamase [Oceanicoccus sp.]|uniref:class D beta-lactamase n=1 Tax=Oceanicoccus sp. TaxID=2691044 RepID=UPI002619BFCA|nr:class D beta-lactamase [Oceanicoccus sp.]MCP3907425.1 class D beta-lactamase [Oceanicoccus sp.]
MLYKSPFFISVFFILVLFLISPISYGQNSIVERADWVRYFDQFSAKGTIVVIDERGPYAKNWVFNNARALKRYSPASTYKIPHTLFALDAGAVEDEFQVFEWDGIKRDYELHNQNQDLRSAMQYSAIWVYEQFAKKIGKKRVQRYLREIDYGNKDLHTAGGNYWVEGDLAISAYEQVAFLKKLHRNQLPFSSLHQGIVKDIMQLDKGDTWTLCAKTGWDGGYGWWVGWVDWPTGPVFFALNIDTPNKADDLYKREAIARVVLQSLDALPSG